MENQIENFELLNLKFLAKKSGMTYAKLRNNILGKYTSLTDQEKTRLYNTIQEEVEKACLALGFTFDGKAVRKKA